MKKAFLTVVLLVTAIVAKAQIDANALMGLPTATTVEMNGITGAAVGQCLYNTDNNAIYYYTGTVWQRTTDDQDASEVNLATAVDLDEGGASSPTNETTVEQALQAIAPITSKAGRVFYPPSIAIDASTNGIFSIDLYQQYINQFDNPTVSSTGAPDIPIYARTELYYYVTYADPTVFGNGTAVQNMSIDADGNLSYQIFNQPVDYNALINVVFVVR